MILWLTNKAGYSGGIRAVLASKLAEEGVKSSSIIFNSLHFKSPLLSECDPKKMVDKFAMKQALKVLDNEIEQLKPSLIVINDDATLRCVVGKRVTLATTRGSLYYYRNIPCLVIDGFNSIRFKSYGKFVFGLDLAKIARWAKNEQINEPAFDYRLCKTVDEVLEHCAAAENAEMVSSDTETASGFITCITFTYNDKSGKLISFVVPFFNPLVENGAYWKEEADEIRVRKAIRKLNASPVIKVFQNGTYDCAYEIKEGFPPVNYLVDTQNLMHSMWVEAPKKLHHIASYFCDYYTYWKDDNKGDADDKLGWTKNDETVNRYWRYCGLDGYYTYLGAVQLIRRITKLKWALRNYSAEFSLSVGPFLAASLRGIKIERQRHAKITREQMLLADKGRQSLRNLSGEEDYNINAPNDNAWLLYDVLGARKTRLQRKGSKYGLRSTDEKVLNLMKEQRNFFVSHTIDRLLRAKKPATWLTKYGNMSTLTYKNDRFLSWHNAAATETFRANSGDSQFWTGTNGQNLQPFTQEMFVADPDYVIVDFDYSASDDWFIAYESEDEKKMEILASKDTHSFHAATFFKLNYEQVVAGKKKYEEWVVHAIKGVRQIAKKFAHGKNFLMGPEMLYNLMGRDMAVETARMMGYARPEALDDKELIGMCRHIMNMYDKLYPRVEKWQEEIVKELRANDGLATNAFGITRNFFGSPDDHATQRQLSAYFGQSGTSGNINRALRKVFYSGVDDGKKCLFVLQVHDSLKFLIHKSALSIVPLIKNIMEEPITLKGRTFIVPVNVECGLTDGKHMLAWTPDVTYEQIVAHEHKEYDKKFPKGNAAILAELESINFEDSLIAELDEKLGTFEDQEDASETSELELAETESE